VERGQMWFGWFVMVCGLLVWEGGPLLFSLVCVRLSLESLDQS
jgi:hypothetical protein